MPDPFDGYEFLMHLRARWRLGATTIGAAVGISLVLSLALPKKYAARVAMVIEAPAGSDPRAATAVSPLYLESLRTYEHFASSDQLFSQAVDRFQLRAGWPPRSLESLKRSVLQVSIPRNTKILEVEVTLRDPKKAHAVARYIADETIQLNRRTSRTVDEELIAETRKRAEEAAARLRAAEDARSRATQRSPTPQALRDELDQLGGAREEVERLKLSAELSTADSAKARLEGLRRQAADLDRQIAARQELLARRTSEIEALSGQHESAWTAHEEMQKRLRDLEAAAGARAERLNLIDPGVVPERPAFPNLPLNLLVAAALGLILSVLYLTLEFSLQARKAESLRRGLRVAAKS